MEISLARDENGELINICRKHAGKRFLYEFEMVDHEAAEVAEALQEAWRARLVACGRLSPSKRALSALRGAPAAALDFGMEEKELKEELTRKRN